MLTFTNEHLFFMKRSYKLKTTQEVLTKIKNLDSAFLKKYGYATKCSLNYALSGNKPDYIYELVIRAENTDQMKEIPLLEELYQSL
jgi:hypothetical protein